MLVFGLYFCAEVSGVYFFIILNHLSFWNANKVYISFYATCDKRGISSVLENVP